MTAALTEESGNPAKEDGMNYHRNDEEVLEACGMERSNMDTRTVEIYNSARAIYLAAA